MNFHVEFKAGTWRTRTWTVLMTFVFSTLSLYEVAPKSHIPWRASPSVIDSCQLMIHYGNEHCQEEWRISQTLTRWSGATERAHGNGTFNISLAVARQSCGTAGVCSASVSEVLSHRHIRTVPLVCCRAAVCSVINRSVEMTQMLCQ